MSMNKHARQVRRFYNKVKIQKQKRIRSFYMDNKNVVSGKFRKQHSLNCGVSSCPGCCNPRKVFGHITIKEKESDIYFKLDKQDYYNIEKQD